MGNRNFKLKYTRLQIILEVIGILILAAMFIFLFLNWGSIPEKIPGHYNALGQVDRWGNKLELLILPIVSILLYLLLTIIGLFPSVWNVPVEVTDQNREIVYSNLKTMLILLKAVVLGIFFWLNYNSMHARPLPVYFLPVVLAVAFGTPIFFTIRVSRLVKK